MDRFEAMSIASAVAETGSLSAASRGQKTPLATVSRKVSELEAHLRTKLFNRTSRALVLTDAGRSFVTAAKRILTDVSELERAASGEYTTPRGDLTVSASVECGASRPRDRSANARAWADRSRPMPRALQRIVIGLTRSY